MWEVKSRSTAVDEIREEEIIDGIDAMNHNLVCITISPVPSLTTNFPTVQVDKDRLSTEPSLLSCYVDHTVVTICPRQLTD